MTVDTIVVGAGSAGCAAAAGLGARGKRVLLLESGDAAESHPETLAADQYKKAFVQPSLMYERFTTPQAGCANKRLFAGTGRGVGGSGAINAMVYTRGAAVDYDQWDIPGWRWTDVVPAFVELEAQLQPSRPSPSEFCDACIRAAVASGFQHKDELNDGALDGFLGYEWMNLQGNQRRSAYVALLRPQLGQGNVELHTGAQVRRVLFEGRRAVGVEWEEAGLRRTARAGEVWLAAGALESPRLLKLSGVGPASELTPLGIPVVADRPAVGENLHDHPNVQIFHLARRASDSNWAQLYGFHRAKPDSSLPAEAADTCYVFYSARTSFKEGMTRLVPGMVLPERAYRMGWPVAAIRSTIGAAFKVPGVQRAVDHIWGVVVILGKPKSRGRLTLASADPLVAARVDPAYFSDPEDLEVMIRGVRLARRIADAEPLAAWRGAEIMPGRRTDSDEAIGDFIRNNAMTTYHFAGTCRMSSDDSGVVDPQLRVRGVDGLRVVDASIIPFTPVSAMNAPSMLVGFRAATF